MTEDGIWDALFQYLIETVLPTRLQTQEYRELTRAGDKTERALCETLTPEQRELLEAHLRARDRVDYYEDAVSFQEAVTIGKWMVK